MADIKTVAYLMNQIRTSFPSLEFKGFNECGEIEYFLKNHHEKFPGLSIKINFIIGVVTFSLLNGEGKPERGWTSYTFFTSTHKDSFGELMPRHPFELSAEIASIVLRQFKELDSKITAEFGADILEKEFGRIHIYANNIVRQPNSLTAYSFSIIKAFENLGFRVRQYRHFPRTNSLYEEYIRFVRQVKDTVYLGIDLCVSYRETAVFRRIYLFDESQPSFENTSYVPYIEYLDRREEYEYPFKNRTEIYNGIDFMFSRLLHKVRQRFIERPRNRNIDLYRALSKLRTDIQVDIINTGKKYVSLSYTNEMKDPFIGVSEKIGRVLGINSYWWSDSYDIGRICFDSYRERFEDFSLFLNVIRYYGKTYIRLGVGEISLKDFKAQRYALVHTTLDTDSCSSQDIVFTSFCLWNKLYHMLQDGSLKPYPPKVMNFLKRAVDLMKEDRVIDSLYKKKVTLHTEIFKRLPEDRGEITTDSFEYLNLHSLCSQYFKVSSKDTAEIKPQDLDTLESVEFVFKSGKKRTMPASSISKELRIFLSEK